MTGDSAMRKQFDLDESTTANFVTGRSDEGKQLRYRAIFISDLHLGTPGCQAEALVDFLKNHESDTL